ncbi:hypothetical protein Q9966_007614 [Columba livia]|nr:hypothetical protein Q9966_007614 [Columba livia]
MENLQKDNLLKYFTEYASKEGSTTELSVAGLKSLLQNQFAQYLKDSSSVDTVIKSLDKDKDGNISFDEFVTVVKKITGTEA